MDSWIIQLGICVIAFAIHAMFAHDGDFGDTYECDRRWDRAYDNFEFHAFAWLLFIGIGAVFAYFIWKGMQPDPPVAYAATAPVAARAQHKSVQHKGAQHKKTVVAVVKGASTHTAKGAAKDAATKKASAAKTTSPAKTHPKQGSQAVD